MSSGLVMHDDEFRQISQICERLTNDANAKVVFLVDRNGQLVASSGHAHTVDTTSLASLTAGNIAVMGGLARLIGEKEFPTHFHEGERESIHMSVVGRVVLVVIFDTRSTLGLVRLRVRRATEDLARVYDEMARKPRRNGSDGPLADVTDAEIDHLFGDRT